jgi:hypothetical protein
MRYLEHGRVADTSRLRRELDWAPRTTTEAMQSFVERSPRIFNPETVAAAEERVLALLAGRRPAGPKETVRA